eukprot:10952114-Ditylum_brightwellii.AAC.1
MSTTGAAVIPPTGTLTDSGAAATPTPPVTAPIQAPIDRPPVYHAQEMCLPWTVMNRFATPLSVGGVRPKTHICLE